MTKLVPLLFEIANRPLNRGSRIRAMARFLRWQVGIRILSRTAIIPFVADSVLAVSRGMTGATFNIYAGLQEFEEMAFLLHFLREGDLFIDVGANVGAYTILASAVARAFCISFEPVPSTFSHLWRNVSLNRVDELCELHNEGLSSRNGKLTFTADRDTMNRVLKGPPVLGGALVEVPVRTLDEVVESRAPRLIKIDVEGFEAEVLLGGARVFENKSLMAVILELNGSGIHYGYSDSFVASKMMEWGFVRCTYDPFTRTLNEAGPEYKAENALFIRDVHAVRCLLLQGRHFTVLGNTL